MAETGSMGTLQRSSFFGGTKLTISRAVVQRSPRVQLETRAVLKDRGKEVASSDITVKRSIGEGSYGQVFEGYLNKPSGRERVVLKRVKARVEGAKEMGEMEHLLNVYASRASKHSIADFVGYCEVEEEEATRSLTEGLWLLWRYEGGKTLAHYLRRRDCMSALAADLDVPEASVLPTVMQQIFEGLSGLHSAGLVHRDVKPLNIIFAEEERRFKLIDLGACADLRTGTNYVPDESILDPTYCPPEQYCMPTDSPHLGKTMKPFAVAMSPMLWTRYKPDRFDSYSCGLVLMQLAIPKLRSASGIRAFNSAYKKLRYDLEAWRAAEKLPARETELLDADGGAGWDLAGALLRPRDIQVDERGGVMFVNNGGAIRLPVKAALKHRFLKQARAPVVAVPWARGTSSQGRMSKGPGGTASMAGRENAGQGASMLGSALGVWRAAGDRLRDLEGKLSNQAKAVESQTGKVEMLKAKYARGQVEKEVLERQSGLLQKMTGRLNLLQGEFGDAASNAQRALGLIRPPNEIRNQAKAVAAQSRKVETLKAAYETGVVKREELDRQEGLLHKMVRRLGSLQEEVGASGRVLGFLQQRPAATEAAIEALEEEVEEPEEFGKQSFFGRLLAKRSGAAVSEAEIQTAISGSTGSKNRSGSGSAGGGKRRSTPDGNISGSGSASGGSVQSAPDGAISEPSGSSARRSFLGSLFDRSGGTSQEDARGTEQPAKSTSGRSDLPPSLQARQLQGTEDGVRTGSSNRRKTGRKEVNEPGKLDVPSDEKGKGGLNAKDAAVTGIYAGLKLTGLALKMASDMATAIGKDSEKVFAQAEAEVKSRKQRQAATAFFLEMLREADPPVTVDSRWEDVQRSFRWDPRVKDVTEAQQAKVFNAYVDELSRREREESAKAEQVFKALLEEVGLIRESTWPAVESRLLGDARYTDLPTDIKYAALFEGVMQSRQAQFNFLDLLAESDNPPITRETTWGKARRQVSGDPRFAALSERERRDIFSSFQAGLVEPASLAPMVAAKGKVGLQAMPSQEEAVLASKESLQSLQTLRSEQQRLKSEYEKMEAKLKEMERRLQEQQGSDSLSSVDLDFRQDSDGNFVLSSLLSGSKRGQSSEYPSHKGK